MVDGSVMTVDLVTGDLVSSVATTATTPVVRIGVRPDGLIVTASSGRIELVDRRTGPTGVVAEVSDVVDGGVRPDGTVVTLGTDGMYEVIELEGNALVERSWPIDGFVRVAFNDGKAGLRRQANDPVEIVDLVTGVRTEMELRTPDGKRFLAEGVYPEPDGVWAIAWSGIVARWEGETMVERIDFPGDMFSWTRFDDTLAVLSPGADGNPEANLVSLVHDDAGVLFTVPAPNGYSVHPALDGGLHVFDEDGSLRTYDSSGELIGEFTTGAENPLINTMDPSSGVLAVASELGGVVVIDPEQRYRGKPSRNGRDRQPRVRSRRPTPRDHRRRWHRQNLGSRSQGTCRTRLEWHGRRVVVVSLLVRRSQRLDLGLHLGSIARDPTRPPAVGGACLRHRRPRSHVRRMAALRPRRRRRPVRLRLSIPSRSQTRASDSICPGPLRPTRSTNLRGWDGTRWEERSPAVAPGRQHHHD